MPFKSIVEDVELNKQSFETAISCGLKVPELMKYFGVSYGDLCDFTAREYQKEFPYIFDLIRARCLAEYKEVLRILASRGNPTAINTLNQFVYDMTEEDKVQKIQIISGIPDVPDEEK